MSPQRAVLRRQRAAHRRRDQKQGKTLPMWRCTAVTVWCLRADGGQLLARKSAVQ